MLSLGKLAAGQQRYYLETVALGAEEYDTGAATGIPARHLRRPGTQRPQDSDAEGSIRYGPRPGLLDRQDIMCRMDAHGRRFREEGSFVVECALEADDLVLLQRECQRLVEEREAEMDRLGLDVLDLDHRGRRYFLRGYDTSAPLRRFLTSDLMAKIARAALGDTVYLFNEQFVVKAADTGLSFSWHQDSGFIRYPHEPYLTCWIPLDDVDAENGTVWLLPYSRAGTRAAVEHVLDGATNDLIGYVGDDPGDPLILSAGSIACFSSTVFHRSGPNTTGRTRRAFVAQYSTQPILDEHGAGPRHLAVPLTTPDP